MDEAKTIGDVLNSKLGATFKLRGALKVLDKFSPEELNEMYAFMSEDEHFGVSRDVLFEGINISNVDFNKELLQHVREMVYDKIEEFDTVSYLCNIARSCLGLDDPQSRLNWFTQLLSGHQLMLNQLFIATNPVMLVEPNETHDLNVDEQKFVTRTATLILHKIHRLHQLFSDTQRGMADAMELYHRRLLVLPVEAGQEEVFAEAVIAFAEKFNKVSATTAQKMRESSVADFLGDLQDTLGVELPKDLSDMLNEPATVESMTGEELNDVLEGAATDEEENDVEEAANEN